MRGLFTSWLVVLLGVLGLMSPAAMAGDEDNCEAAQLLADPEDDYSWFGNSTDIHGDVAIVASYNLDPRSAKLNSEIALIAEDIGMAQELKGLMDQRLGNARKVGVDGVPIGYSEPYPGVSRKKILMMKIVKR